MPRPDRRGKSDTRYFLRFAGTATLLLSGTLVLVLYVLPQRYVLSSGFREGTLILPDPSTPFEPMNAARIAELPPPAAPDEIPRGPAEIFWARVIPMLEAERYEAAIPLFADYLGEYPADRDVRREYALTLAAAGYPERAIPLLEQLLAARDDAELRLLLARVLRDVGRVGDASEHYSNLLARTPENEALWLEWAQALAWVRDYAAAEDVLLDALEVYPDSVPLRVELARIYYYTNRLEDADAILADMTETQLVSAGAVALRDDVRWALTPPPEPEVVPPPPPSTLDQAIAARDLGELDRAEELFRAALEENPEDAASWEAWANFLQYEREDFDGALEALKNVERITGGRDSRLQFRMAQLEIWTDRTDDARVRLEALLVLLDEEAAAPVVVAVDEEGADATAESPPVTRADVYALLGDLERWDGDRLAAVGQYERALAEDPEHAGATEGLAIIRADVDRMMIETEQPHLGGIANSLADTDDFLRLDLGGEWFGIDEDWVWGTRTGGRFVEGLDLTGGAAQEEGLFAELEGARWWRWGTIRTALHGGVQTIRAGEVDLGIGASARLVGAGGRRTDVRFDHEPAFGLTNTLQSVQANVRQDRLQASHTEPLGERWVTGVTAEVASIDHVDIAGAARNTRLQGALSVGRILSRQLTLGVSARALHYRDAAPAAAGFPLYWDPDANLSVGPYLQWTRPLSTWWEMDARLTPGVAWINERATTDVEVVPDLSARVGVRREGAKYRTAVEFFYGQGRFTGYRSYGVNVSFGARGWFGRGGSTGRSDDAGSPIR